MVIVVSIHTLLLYLLEVSPRVWGAFGKTKNNIISGGLPTLLASHHLFCNLLGLLTTLERRNRLVKARVVVVAPWGILIKKTI